jgi:hypothetical protein
LLSYMIQGKKRDAEIKNECRTRRNWEVTVTGCLMRPEEKKKSARRTREGSLYTLWVSSYALRRWHVFNADCESEHGVSAV